MTIKPIDNSNFYNNSKQILVSVYKARAATVSETNETAREAALFFLPTGVADAGALTGAATGLAEGPATGAAEGASVMGSAEGAKTKLISN